MSAPLHIIEETPDGFLVRSEPAHVDAERFGSHDQAMTMARLRRFGCGGKVDDRTALAGKAVKHGR